MLHVYKEIEMFKKENNKGTKMAILSYDEKSGIQAIGNITADLKPMPKLYSNWARDYEYKRYGTLSLLASIDLLTGEVYAEVHERHRNREFFFTPVHASWLNLIEVFFSKMTRSFLRGIRVKSKKELKDRILKYIKEVNEMPTIFSWKWKMNEIVI